MKDTKRFSFAVMVLMFVLAGLVTPAPLVEPVVASGGTVAYFQPRGGDDYNPGTFASPKKSREATVQLLTSRIVELDEDKEQIGRTLTCGWVWVWGWGKNRTPLDGYTVVRGCW